ncbi:MAG: phosphotransferase family protein [Acidimicrobiales bacterium]
MTDLDAGLLALVHRALPVGFTVVGHGDAGEGRGVFSQVTRVALRWPAGHDGPASVVLKVPAAGANGIAAARAGAYRREALAYRRVLPSSPVAHPHPYLVETSPAPGAADDGGERQVEIVHLVLEDLGHHRRVDQVDGLGADDAVAVAVELRRFHDRWAGDAALDDLDVRRATPTALDPAALERGVDVLRTRWADRVDPAAAAALARAFADRAELVARFAAAGPVTLCHGDPRADNLVFGEDGRPVLFDWQQLAVQIGEADLAWLAATSLTVDDRRRADRALVEAYGTTVDRYRAGLVLPALAVLLLVQREADDERTRRFIAASVDRIGTAVADLDLA